MDGLPSCSVVSSILRCSRGRMGDTISSGQGRFKGRSGDCSCCDSDKGDECEDGGSADSLRISSWRQAMDAFSLSLSLSKSESVTPELASDSVDVWPSSHSSVSSSSDSVDVWL